MFNQIIITFTSMINQKEDVVSSLSPEAYTMVGGQKIFFPEAYSPRHNKIPTSGLAKSVDYSGKILK